MSDIGNNTLGATSNRSDIRSVIAMSLPMVITMSSPMIMRVVNYVFVSYLGTAAQAAIVPAQMLLWCYIAMCMGITTSVSTFASQSLGRNRPSDCSTYAWHSLYLSVLLGSAGGVMWFVFPSIFGLFGHAPEVASLEVIYCRVSMWSFLPTIAAQSLSAFFVGVHRPSVTMWAAIETNALNIVLDYSLIFGKFGMPKLGLAGAALGIVIASHYQLLRLLITFVGAETDKDFSSRSTWRMKREKLRSIWRIGWPQGIHWLSDVLVWALFNNMLVGHFSMYEMAASNSAWQYLRISILPVMGIGQALLALVGQTIGQGNPERARRLMRYAGIISLAYIVPLSLLYIVGRKPLMMLFSNDPTIIAVGAKIMICLAFLQLFDVIGTMYYYGLRGAGDTLWPMAVYVIGHWIVLMGGGALVIAFCPDWGVVGPWATGAVLLALTGVLLAWRWYRGDWMKINLFQTTSETIVQSIP